jgi:hypothetical protein
MGDGVASVESLSQSPEQGSNGNELTTNVIRNLRTKARRPERYTAERGEPLEVDELSKKIKEKIVEVSQDGFVRARVGFVMNVVESVHELWNPQTKIEYLDEKRRGTKAAYSSLAPEEKDFVTNLLNIYDQYLMEENYAAAERQEVVREIAHLKTIGMIEDWLDHE